MRPCRSGSWTGRAVRLTWTGDAVEEHVIANVNDDLVFNGIDAAPFNAQAAPQAFPPGIGFMMEEVD